MFNTQKFGAYLVQLRKKADWSQVDLADHLQLSRQTVADYETGERFPDTEILSRLTELFGLSLPALLAAGEEDDPQTPLRNDVLEKISSGLAAHGVDISHVLDLSQYLSDAETADRVQQASFASLDGEAERDLMKHLIPLLDEKSKTALFGKIIEGELDWRNLEMMMPYITYLDSQIEAAYVEGALPGEVMTWLEQALADEQEKRKAAIQEAMGHT